ncbi:MAG: molybdenum cofactor biosynthesis protein [Selenomonadaceae bacterium]|nr:molybdenum cofactor biosynthesis protein [Selenomonadaceae bacterium]MBR1859114.1 molybdenum cofactor biosynthesis protein [Selenomonadaceae bacterium]
MGKIKAICISEKRGTRKTQVESATFITEYGIDGDAHAGSWHRQVSFLGLNEIEDFKRRGGNVNFGDFGENIVDDEITFKKLPVGTRLNCGDVFFEITQIGKECHSHCQIYHQVGDCIMPREGVFARVLHGGVIKVGDELNITTKNMPLDAAIITSSDKGFAGEREDLSGAKVEEMLKAAGYSIADKVILPDDKDRLAAQMKKYANVGIGLVITTGGTGFSMRDVTPEATIEVCDRMAPGIAEAMRLESLKITPRAMLSRAVAGICKRTLIVNLPGSVKAVAECLGFVLPTLRHGIEILRGETGECAKL